MEIFRLRKEDVTLFAGLDPFGWMALLELPDAFALGATDGDRGAGLMVCVATKEALVVHWLATAGAVEGRGLGEALLRRAFELAERADIPTLYAPIAPFYEKRANTSGRASFFKERLFQLERPLAGLWQGTLGELLSQEDFGNDAHLPKPVSLATFRAAQAAEHLATLDEQEGGIGLYPLKGELEKIDAHISFLILDEGEACGAILAQRLEESLIPVFFYAESDREAKALWIACGAAAAKRYGQDMPVDIILAKPLMEDRAGNEAKMVERAMKALPKEAKGGKLLIAKTSDYVDYAWMIER